MHYQNLQGMDAWSRHKHFIDTYAKHYQGKSSSNTTSTPAKTELDILHENHRFLRSEQDDQDLSWEKRIAKKYYDRLFKEYALVELKFYREGRVAMRWRTENEVARGKGQFTCAALRCDESQGLQSWEVNFAYVEQGEKKNALVKVRLCEHCSRRLNYKKKQKAVKTDKRRQSPGLDEEEHMESHRKEHHRRDDSPRRRDDSSRRHDDSSRRRDDSSRRRDYRESEDARHEKRSKRSRSTNDDEQESRSKSDRELSDEHRDIETRLSPDRSASSERIDRRHTTRRSPRSSSQSPERKYSSSFEDFFNGLFQ